MGSVKIAKIKCLQKHQFNWHEKVGVSKESCRELLKWIGLKNWELGKTKVRSNKGAALLESGVFRGVIVKIFLLFQYIDNFDAMYWYIHKNAVYAIRVYTIS